MARVDAGWTQEELAAKSHVGQSQISVIGSDESNRVYAHTLLAVAKALQIDPVEAFAGRLVYRRRTEDILGSDARRLEAGLGTTQHAKWIAYGHGLLASQPSSTEEVLPDRRKK